MPMDLRVLVPFQVFAEKSGVSRIVAETRTGSFGLLPRRLDCVAALTPGILDLRDGEEGESYLAVDEGVLVKTGPSVNISVRRAVAGTDLGQIARSGRAGVSDSRRAGAECALGDGEAGIRISAPSGGLSA